ncbi:MAG: family 20 glycosylhydrolase, partial [Planctomycetes bacterium]|nr:family 20 glycosylhydrolase [Planctomycetota bacterium]
YGAADLRIRRDKTIQSRDAYKLTVSSEGVEIRAGADAGAYYGVQTLRDMLALHGKALPACTIDDSPDFPRRGVYHDCSRDKVPTIDTLKALVERLAHWKINELQLYVENVFTFRRHPKIGRGYSPFTPEELLDLQDFCKLHHVRFVGSLASFGHMERILQLPEYIGLAEMPGYRGHRGGTTLCPTDPGSIKLVADLYEEFLPLFEAEDFNVCCDETWELGKGRSAARAARIGTGRLYLDFLLKIHKLCRKYGKRMNAWADIVLAHPELLNELPRDIVMLNWDYHVDGRRVHRTGEIASAGLAHVVCPGTSGWSSHGSRLANAIGNVAQFAAEGRKHHAEGLLNTNWGDYGHRNTLGVSLHGFAHGAAHSWHGRGVDDQTFTETFCRHHFGPACGSLRQTARLAKSLRILSATEVKSGCRLFHALVEPLAGPVKGALRQDIKQDIPQSGLKAVIANLSDESIWPEAQRGAEWFEKLALREFVLASRMDVLAAKRVLAAQKLRAGGSVSSGELRSLRADTHRVGAEFEKLWLARNKPSRLRDNMAKLARVEKEAARLARR